MSQTEAPVESTPEGGKGQAKTTPLGRFADRFESIFFPIVFLSLAGKDAYKLIRDWPMIRPALGAINPIAPSPSDFITLASVLMLAYLILSSLLNAYLLLRRSSAPKRTPDRLVEIIVPLLGTFGTIASSILIDLVPKSMDYMFISDQYRGISTIAGATIVSLGLVVSLRAEWHLNTSYGVFVQVREPVMTGMYSYVRHPMYASYFFVNFGIFLLYPTVSYGLCSIFFITVLIVRARLEEAKLSDYSEEYRAYKARTPMIIPRFWVTESKSPEAQPAADRASSSEGTGLGLAEVPYFGLLWGGILGSGLLLDFFERRQYELGQMGLLEQAGNLFYVGVLCAAICWFLGYLCELASKAGYLRAVHFALLFVFFTVHFSFVKLRYTNELMKVSPDQRFTSSVIAGLLLLALAYALTRNLRSPLPGVLNLQTIFRRALIPLVALVGLGLLVGLVSRPQPSVGAQGASGPPNVIVLTFDGMTASRMSSYGYATETTPNLDSFGAQSWLFENFYANANFTEGGMMALEGNSPLAVGPNLVDLPGLSETLAQNGYQHQAYFAHGFAQPSGRPAMEKHLSTTGSQTALYRALARVAPDRWLWWLGALLSEESARLWPYTGKYDSHVFWTKPRYPAALSLTDALDYLKRHPSGAYVRIHLFEPHYPYLYQPELGASFGADAWTLGDLLYKTYAPPQEGDAQKLGAQYDQSLVRLDGAVGDFLAHLRNQGHFEKSWIVVSSDHGESLTQGFLGHAYDKVPQSVSKIPLMVHPPGNTQGVRVKALASQIDLAPTLLESLGLQAPASFSGQSLLPYVKQPTKDRDILVKSLSRNVIYSAPGEAVLYWSKYRLSFLFPDPTKVRLSDLSVDPRAESNIANSHSDLVTEILTKGEYLKPKT